MSLEALINGPDYHVPESICLNCEKGIDGATPTDGSRAPEPNDVAVCAYCGHLQAYGDDLKFRELTDAEIIECSGDPEVLMAQEFARHFRQWEDEE